MHNTATDPAVAAALRALGTEPDSYGPTLNTALSLPAVETVGTALAEALRPYRPATVALWGAGDEMVLAHVVARELGAAVSLANELEGLVTVAPAVTPGTRLALLATAWEDPQRLATLRTWAEKHGADIVAVAAVFATPAQRGLDERLPAVHLADTADGSAS